MSATEPKRSKNQTAVMQDKAAANGACKKRTKENFKGLDWFGQSLNLTWNGEDQYKTTFGAAISLVLMIILLGYSIYRVIYMVNRYNPTVSKTTLIRNESEDEPFRPQDYGFDFAFGLSKPLDPSIGFFTAKYIEQEVIGQERMKTSHQLAFSTCGTDHFNYKDQEAVVKYGISNFQCLTDEDYDFQGNFYRSEMRYLELKLWKCNNMTKNNTIYQDVECQDGDVIDAYLTTEIFNFAFVNTLFATDNYVTPIEHYIDDSLFFELDPHVIQKANFFVQQSEASLEDDILQLGQNEEVTFYQVQNIRTYADDYTAKDGYMVAIYMRSDKAFDSYERKVTDILTLMGDIGGLQGSLIAIGVIFVGFITSRMFMSKIIRKIYQIRKYENFDKGPAQQSSNPRNRQNLRSQEQSPDPENQNASQNNTGKKLSYKSQIFDDSQNLQKSAKRALNNANDDDTQSTLNIKQREQFLEKDFKTKQQIHDKDIGSILFAFLNRTRFKYTVTNIIEYIIGCMCFRKLDANRTKRQFKKHFLFEKAEEKFMQELDVVRIVKTLRKFKMLLQALLDQKHRLLLKFQRQNLIETSSSSSDSDNNAFDTVRLMENNNPLIRLVTFGKLKKMMTQFKGKQVDSLERNMMRGMFIRKLKDFAEDQKEIAENESMLQRLKKDMKIEREEEEVDISPNTKMRKLSFRDNIVNHNELEIFNKSFRSKVSLEDQNISVNGAAFDQSLDLKQKLNKFKSESLLDEEGCEENEEANHRRRKNRI